MNLKNDLYESRLKIEPFGRALQRGLFTIHRFHLLTPTTHRAHELLEKAPTASTEMRKISAPFTSIVTS